MISPIATLVFFPRQQQPTVIRRHDKNAGTKLTYAEGGINVARNDLHEFVKNNPAQRLCSITREDGTTEAYTPATRDIIALELDICPTCLRADDYQPIDRILPLLKIIYSARILRRAIADQPTSSPLGLALELFDAGIEKVRALID